MGRLFFSLLLALLGWGCASAGPVWAEKPLRSVTIQLKWQHQAQFAGYYAAVQQGYFSQAGLDVTLKPTLPAEDPVAAVINGKADFGIGSAELILERAKGSPVVAVAAIFQHSPFILLARPDIRNIHDLAGRRVMLEPNSAELVAYLASQHVPLESLKIQPHNGDPLSLRDGRIDAMTAYVTSEPYMLDKVGASYRIFDPKAAGIDFYGDTLFTSESLARSDPTLVRRVRDCVIKGWRYALDHPDDMADLIHRDYAPDLSQEALLYEAGEIRKLAIPEVVDIGYMSPERWRYILDSFQKIGLARGTVDLEDFLFDYHKPVDLQLVYGGLGLATALTLISVAVAARMRRLNARLVEEIDRRSMLEDELRRQAGTDFLTGLANRRRFLDLGGQEVLRARRFQTALSVMMIDIDLFKQVNDTYGHPAGDQVIRRIGEICRAQLRDVDLLARFGGEEYAVLLPHTALAQARDVAERIRAAVGAEPLTIGSPDDPTLALAVSCSIGVACCDHHQGAAGDEQLDAILQRADSALYRAKNNGRNCVRL